TNSLALTSQPNGALQYRVRGLQDGRIGYYVTGASNAISIVVDLRAQVDITSQITRAISNVSLNSGVVQVDVAFTNNSSQTYVPFVDLNVIGVNSGTGMVKVINADNAQDGRSLASAALFGYSDKLGTDQQFAPAEVSGTRTFRFQDSTSELFTFDAVVTAYISGSAGGRGGVVTGSSTSGGSS